MSVQITAFIGHNFDEKDESLIEKIKAFVMQNDVHYTTGEKAQNKSVSEKVKQRINDCDVFIGIFTAAEPLCRPSCNSNPILQLFKADKSPRQFTTSNWVIQESGYALGKGRPTIFMVEKGVDSFPELQGDQEYIPFDRADLNEALLRFTMMLTDFKSKFYQLKPAGVASNPSTTALGNGEKDAEKESANPKSNAFGEMIDAFQDKDISKIDTVYKDKFRPTLKPDEHVLWDALVLKQKYQSGDATAFVKLKEYVQQTDGPDAMCQLAQCYEFGDQYQEAVNEYTRALSKYTALHDKTSAAIGIAENLERLSGVASAILYLLEGLTKYPDFEGSEEVFKSLIEFSKKNSDDYLYILFCEKLLTINAVNKSVRFDLALKYSNLGEDSLAILHYKKYLDIVDDAGALNNIAVSYASASLHARAVEFYKRSSSKNETLAMANLAEKYLNQGFIEEAEKILKTAEALTEKGVNLHQNVGLAKKRIKDLLEEEEKKEKELLGEAEKVHRFRVNHALSYCANSGAGCVGVQTKLCEIEKWGQVPLAIDFNQGLLKGQLQQRVEDSNFFLASFLSSQRGLLEPNKFKLRNVTIEGTFRNLSGRYTLKVTETSEMAGAKPQDVLNVSGLFNIQSDFSAIDVLEDSKDKKVLKAWILSGNVQERAVRPTEVARRSPQG